MVLSTGPCEQSDHVEEYLWFRCEPITDCGQSPVFKSLIRRKWGQEGSEDPFVYQVTDHHEPLDLAQHGGKNVGNAPPGHFFLKFPTCCWPRGVAAERIGIY